MNNPQTTLKMQEEVITSVKWTNIFFLRDGRSFVSPYVLPTEDEARKHAIDSEKTIIPYKSYDSHSGITFLGKDYLYALQVPA